MENEGLGNAVCEALSLKNTAPDLAEWQKMVDKFNNPKRKVTIALVGKYVELHDAYWLYGTKSLFR